MLTSASDVTITTTNSRNRRSGSNGSGMPAISDPSVMSTSAREHRLDRAGDVEPEDQLELA